MNDNDREIIEGILQSLLVRMGIVVEIEVEDSPGTALFNLKTPDSSILIGQHGANLAALQYIARVLAHKKLPGTATFVVDVEGYKKHREEFLREVARQAAVRVRETQESLLLKPMLAYERRVIHAELNLLPDIYTESVGDEPERRVLIKPKSDLSKSQIRQSVEEPKQY